MISVIIPVYNSAQTLKECLTALFRQNTPSFEVIVVDDCSTDSSVKVAEAYPCKLVRMPENKGPGAARNEGAKIAKGDILAFTDSDCVVSEDWLEKMDNLFKNKKIAAVTGGYSESLDGSYIGRFRLYENIFYNRNNSGFVNVLTTYNFACRKESFQKAGGFAEIYTGEDMLLGYSLYKIGEMVYYDETIKVAHYFHKTLKDYLKQQFSWMKGYINESSRYPESFFVKWPVRRGVLILQLVLELAATVSLLFSLFYPGAWIVSVSTVALLVLLNYRFLRFIMRKEGKGKVIPSFLVILCRNAVWLCAIAYTFPKSLVNMARNASFVIGRI